MRTTRLQRISLTIREPTTTSPVPVLSMSRAATVPSDSFNSHQDYGNVSATRRNRFLATAIYELPVGHGRRYGAHMNRLEELAVGGWQLSNIFLLQSGTFLTAFIPNGEIDPSGTGSGTAVGGAAQRPDRVANGHSGRHDRNHWFNNDAFACPGQTGYASLLIDPVTGRITLQRRSGYKSLLVASAPKVSVILTGPGTVSLSSGLSKSDRNRRRPSSARGRYVHQRSEPHQPCRPVARCYPAHVRANYTIPRLRFRRKSNRPTLPQN